LLRLAEHPRGGVRGNATGVEGDVGHETKFIEANWSGKGRPRIVRAGLGPFSSKRANSEAGPGGGGSENIQGENSTGYREFEGRT